MKQIEIDDELYAYVASQTQFIGESASSILRRCLGFAPQSMLEQPAANVEQTKANDIPSNVEELAQTGKQNESEVNVFHYINKEELALQRGAVGRFLLILSALYRAHTQAFSCVLNIKGRDRLYFAGSEQALVASGNSTKPRQIPGTDYWVITNSNTTRKKLMLTEVANELGYSAELVEKIRDLL